MVGSMLKGAELLLSGVTCGAVPGRAPRPRRPLRQRRAGDATFERIRAADGEVLQEPIDQPDGVRDCAFRDPSGNMLRFSLAAGELWSREPGATLPAN